MFLPYWVQRYQHRLLVDQNFIQIRHISSFVDYKMAEVDIKLEILRSSQNDEEEAMDKETASYLYQAKQEQHNILYLNYKHLQYIPSALVATEDFRCIKQLYLRNNRLEKLASLVSDIFKLVSVF